MQKWLGFYPCFCFRTEPKHGCCHQHPYEHSELTVSRTGHCPSAARAAPLASARRDRSFSRGCVPNTRYRLPRPHTGKDAVELCGTGPREPPAAQPRGLCYWTLWQFVTPPQTINVPVPLGEFTGASHWERRGSQEYKTYRKSKMSRKCLLSWKMRCLNTDLLPCCHLPVGRPSSG